MQYLKINKLDFILMSTISEIASANAHTKLKFKCIKHNTVHEIGWNSFKNKSNGCPKCGEIKYKSNRRNEIEYVRDKFLEKGFYLVDKNYGNNQHMMSCVCVKHGVKHRASLAEILTDSGITCTECAAEKVREAALKSDIEFFDSFCQDEYPSELLENSMYGKTHVEVRCKTCGEVRIQKRSHFLNKHSCQICATKSKGEGVINAFLVDNEISFEPQKRFVDCANKRPLPFDFYLYEENILIEYDGIQHYEYVNRWGGKSGFLKRKHNDRIKDKYCEDNGIKLIRIPYWELNNIENILTHELNLKGENYEN